MIWNFQIFQIFDLIWFEIIWNLKWFDLRKINDLFTTLQWGNKLPHWVQRVPPWVNFYGQNGKK